MNLFPTFDDKETIIHRLQTHISILEQQSTGYYSYEETPSLNDQVSTDETADAASLEKLLQKREYELEQLREQLQECQHEAEEKLRRMFDQLNDSEKKLSDVESDRLKLRQQLQKLQDENDLIKSYLNHLPSDIEYQQLEQSHQILRDQVEQFSETHAEHRKEKVDLRRQLAVCQRTIDEQKQTLESIKTSPSNQLLNAKSLTIDERIEAEKNFEEYRKIIQQLNETLEKEQIQRKQDRHVNETNVKTVESLSKEIEKKNQINREMTNLARQNRQEITDLRVHLLVGEQEQKRLNERLLTSDQLSLATQRVHTTIEKLLGVLDFSAQMLNNEASSSPDVLMLQLSTHRNKSDTIDPSLSSGTVKKIELCDIEQLESKLDSIIDRLLSIRSELIARQFENDLASDIPDASSCRIQ